MRGRSGLKGLQGKPSHPLPRPWCPHPGLGTRVAKLCWTKLQAGSHLDGLSAQGLQHFGADLICTCNPDGGEVRGEKELGC